MYSIITLCLSPSLPRLIRLSSPNLNYIICVGAVILYLDMILLVIPSTDERVVSILCNVNPWFTSIGYSLCYGTILVKMFRVYYIYSNPSPRKKVPVCVCVGGGGGRKDVVTLGPLLIVHGSPNEMILH